MKQKRVFLVKGWKKGHFSRPVEKQGTAAWANIKKRKPISKVPIPGAYDVELARQWVNQNQK